MKRLLCWLIPAIVVITASFFLPQRILSAQQEELMEQVVTLPMDEQFIESGDLSVVEKLKMLCDDTAVSASLDFDYDLKMIQDTLNAQLDTLIEMKAIYRTIDLPLRDSDREILDVYPSVFIDSNKILRIFAIITSTLDVVMDADTGKLLWVISKTETAYGMEQTYKTMQLREAVRKDSAASTELQAWANYFGVSISTITFDDQEFSDIDGNWHLAFSFFTDQRGNTVGFALSHNYANYSIGWRSIESSLAASIRQQIIGEGEDAAGNTEE